MVLERIEWGNFYGYLQSVYEGENKVAEGQAAWPELQSRLQRTLDLRDKITDIERDEIGSINYDMERLRLKERRLQIDGDDTEQALQEIAEQRKELDAEYKALQQTLSDLYQQINRDSIRATVMDGSEITIAMHKIVKAWQPNQDEPAGTRSVFISIR